MDLPQVVQCLRLGMLEEVSLALQGGDIVGEGVLGWRQESDEAGQGRAGVSSQPLPLTFRTVMFQAKLSSAFCSLRPRSPSLVSMRCSSLWKSIPALTGEVLSGCRDVGTGTATVHDNRDQARGMPLASHGVAGSPLPQQPHESSMPRMTGQWKPQLQHVAVLDPGDHEVWKGSEVPWQRHNSGTPWLILGGARAEPPDPTMEARAPSPCPT